MKMHCINEKTAYDSKILNLKNNFSHHSVTLPHEHYEHWSVGGAQVGARRLSHYKLQCIDC